MQYNQKMDPVPGYLPRCQTGNLLKTNNRAGCIQDFLYKNKRVVNSYILPHCVGAGGHAFHELLLIYVHGIKIDSPQGLLCQDVLNAGLVLVVTLLTIPAGTRTAKHVHGAICKQYVVLPADRDDFILLLPLARSGLPVYARNYVIFHTLTGTHIRLHILSIKNLHGPAVEIHQQKRNKEEHRQNVCESCEAMLL